MDISDYSMVTWLDVIRSCFFGSRVSSLVPRDTSMAWHQTEGNIAALLTKERERAEQVLIQMDSS
jgi:hypothetical protein